MVAGGVGDEDFAEFIAGDYFDDVGYAGCVEAVKDVVEEEYWLAVVVALEVDVLGEFHGCDVGFALALGAGVFDWVAVDGHDEVVFVDAAGGVAEDEVAVVCLLEEGCEGSLLEVGGVGEADVLGGAGDGGVVVLEDWDEFLDEFVPFCIYVLCFVVELAVVDVEECAVGRGVFGELFEEVVSVFEDVVVACECVEVAGVAL